VRQKNGGSAGVKLANGTEIETPVMVNVTGPHSYLINRKAGVEAQVNISPAP
jgi:sarcosine oxidase, subunit beta